MFMIPYKEQILYIWDSDYPWDIRVEKICRSLMLAGYEVHIASRNLKRNPVYENDRGLHVHRMRTWGNNRINYACSFPAFFSPFWKKFIDSIIIKYAINLIIVRDLPMAIAAIWAGNRHQLPTVLDMAEDYVALVKGIWELRKFQGLNIVIRNPAFARLVERYALPRFDHVFVVVDEAKDVALRAGVSLEKITVIGNTPELPENKDSSNNNRAFLKEPSAFSNRYIAIYTGGIQLGRGLQIVFDSIPKIIKKIPDFLFVVIGDGYAVEELKCMVTQRNIDQYVHWAGWVNHEELFKYIQVANVGVIPHYRCEHVDTTIPNKIYDYMACGVPVVCSDAPPMKRIISQTGAGLTFKSGDSADLVEAFIQIYLTNIDYGEQGKNAVNSEYNWSVDEKRLLHVVKDVLLLN